MQLPESVSKGLDAFVADAQSVFAERLISVVLYGSAAEGRLRKTSDVNVVVVARSFTTSDASSLNAVLSLTSAAIDLHVMFLLESEIATASELFAVKFSDITKRHRVLYGNDPFPNLTISRAALIARLRQVLLNHLLRTRYVFTLKNGSIDELTNVLAESLSPLRVSASAVLDIRGESFENPKQALEKVAAEFRADGFAETLQRVSAAREGKKFSLPDVRHSLGEVLELTSRMKELIKSLL